MSDTIDNWVIKEEPDDFDYEKEDEDDDEDVKDFLMRDSSDTQNILNTIDTSNIPSFTSFVGEYNFQLMLPQCGRFKSSWEFSNVFNQIFIDINKVLMVQFVLDAPPVGKDLFIRAMPVYCSTDYIMMPVNRCTLHSCEDDPNNEAHSPDDTCFCYKYNQVGHVVRSQMNGVIYSYDRSSKRHSVTVPLSTHHCRRNKHNILYTFTCKSSCQKGMQRRPINLVFTLEDKNGTVFGKTTLAVKICSSPKRDKDRLERDSAMKKIKLSPTRIDNVNALDPRSVTKKDVRRAKIGDELKALYKAKFMFERSLRTVENLLDEL